MSASDAAPLPRLGEVFFDVRGSSRSMRLSWYADTGVAVFSIWQGGMCTGTFRLPIDELPRMIDVLQRGPHGRAPRAADRGYAPDWQTGQAADYQDRADYSTGGSWSDEATRYQSGIHGPERSGRADEGEYGQDRFVPPYLRGQDDAYPPDNPMATGDHRAGAGRPAYPAGRPARSRGRDYPEHPRSSAGYSERPDYDWSADADPPARHSAGKHGGQQAGSRSAGWPDETAESGSDSDVIRRGYRDR